MSVSPRPNFVDRDAWLRARKDLLLMEKAFTREREALSAERRRMPLVRIEKNYAFATVRGDETLADLFKGKRQLAIYHFMFGADWEQGCPSCSFWMDNLDGIDVHLAARDVSFLAVSTAPLEKLSAYKKRMGWRFDWASSGGSDFNRDFGVTFSVQERASSQGYNYGGKPHGEEMPGMSVFQKFEDGMIGHSYSTYGRGLDILNGAYHVLDLTPLGRNEGDLPHPQAWVRRRDQYGAE